MNRTEQNRTEQNRTEHYDNVQKWFNQANEVQQRGLNSEYGYLSYALYIIEQMNAPKNAKVLEIGCGDGLVMKKIAELRPDIDFFGIDISENLIKQAKINNPNATLTTTNVIKGIPFNTKFDRIISFSTIQYFPPEDLLNLNELCLKSVNKEGKIIHCSIPDNKKKLAVLINGMSTRFSPLLANLRAIIIYILKSGERYGNDGSYWHDAEKIKTNMEVAHNDCFVEIKRPSDSWYRFDYVLNFKDSH